MPRQRHRLTNASIQALKPGEKIRKISDGDALRLDVLTSGTKVFRVHYRIDGKQRDYTVGPWPHVSLKNARLAKDQVKAWLAEGKDPSIEKRRLAEENREERQATFSSVAKEFISNKSEINAEQTIVKYHWCLIALTENFRSKPVKEITTRDVVLEVQRIERSGAGDKPRRTHAFVRAVMGHAVHTGRLENNPVTEARYLKPHKKQHRPALTAPDDVGQLLRDISNYQGAYCVRIALEVLAHVFLRPGELRHGKWDQIDFDKKLWNVPASQMKMKLPHVVPLSDQVIAMIQELNSVRTDQWLFPSPSREHQPISENAMSQALKNLKYEGRHVPHGFRRTASTILHEQNFNSDWIERQLAHVEGNPIKAAYNAAEHLDDRRRMMDHWSAYLESLKLKAEP